MKSTFLSLTKMSSDLTVKVAVENTTYVFDKLFDYLVPSAFTDLVQVGKRVLIPFGRGNKKKQGIIFELSPVSDDIPVEKLKSISSVLDDEPVLSKELLNLAEFMKEHYFCTYYDAVKTMLPAGINYKITTLYGVREGVDEEELSEEQQRIFAYLHSKRKAVKSDKILDDFGLDNSVILEDMVKSGYLYKSDEAFRKVSDAVMKMAAPTELADSDNIKLTEKQKAVLDLIKMTGGTTSRVSQQALRTHFIKKVLSTTMTKKCSVLRTEQRTKVLPLLHCQNNSRQPAITSMPNMPIQNRIQAFCSVLQVREKQAFL